MSSSASCLACAALHGAAPCATYRAPDYYRLVEEEEEQHSWGSDILQEAWPLGHDASVEWFHEMPPLASALMHIQCPWGGQRPGAGRQEAVLPAPPSRGEFCFGDADFPAELVCRLVEKATAASAAVPWEKTAREPYPFADLADEPWLAESGCLDDNERDALPPPLLEGAWGLPPAIALLQSYTPSARLPHPGEGIDSSEGGEEDLWALPPELVLAAEEEEEEKSNAVLATSWLDGLLLDIDIRAGGSADKEAGSTPEIDETLDFDLMETAGALPEESEAWLPVVVPPVLPGLADIDLGTETLLRVPGAGMRVEVPDARDLLGELQPEEEAASTKAQAGGLRSPTGSDVETVMLEIGEEGEDCWFEDGRALPVSLLDLGIAALPSIWELEDVVCREVEWPHPSVAMFGAPGPAPIVVGMHGSLAERFQAECWRFGGDRLEIPDLPVPVPCADLPLTEEAKVLLTSADLPPQEGGASTLAFVGPVARADFLAPAESQANSHLCSSCTSSSSRLLEEVLGSGGVAPQSSVDGALVDPLLPPRQQSAWKSSSSTLASSFAAVSLGEERWPARFGEPVWARLGVFKGAGLLPHNLLAVERRVVPQAPLPHARSVVAGTESYHGQQAGTAPAVCGVVQGGHSVDGDRPRDHGYEAQPEEYGLMQQLRGDAELVWATFRSHAGTSNTESVPEGVALQALLQRHAERFLRAREAGADATEDLDLYRILVALHVLVTFRDELTGNGVLQTAFFADALLVRYPESLLRSNMWTNQAFLRLHQLIADSLMDEESGLAHRGDLGAGGCVAAAPRGGVMAGSRLKTTRLCAYAQCTGCGPILPGMGPERAKAVEILNLAAIATAQGRRLVVVFASQQVLEAVHGFVGPHLATVKIHALTPKGRCAQRLLAGGVALVHEAALATPVGVSSPATIVATWEICRVLQQRCTVVGYQPLTLPAVVALVDLRLVARAPATHSAVQQSIGAAPLESTSDQLSPVSSLPPPQAPPPPARETMDDGRDGGCRQVHRRSTPPLVAMVGAHLLAYQTLIRGLETLGVRVVKREVLAASRPDLLLAPQVCCLLRGASIFADPESLEELSRAVHQSLVTFAEVVLFVIVTGSGDGCIDDLSSSSESDLAPVADFLQALHAPCLPKGKSIRVAYSDLASLPAALRAELARRRAAEGSVSTWSACGLTATPEWPQEAFLAALPGLNGASARWLLAGAMSLGELCALDAPALMRVGAAPRHLGGSQQPLSREAAELVEAALNHCHRESPSKSRGAQADDAHAPGDLQAPRPSSESNLLSAGDLQFLDLDTPGAGAGGFDEGRLEGEGDPSPPPSLSALDVVSMRASSQVGSQVRRPRFELPSSDHESGVAMQIGGVWTPRSGAVTPVVCPVGAGKRNAGPAVEGAAQRPHARRTNVVPNRKVRCSARGDGWLNDAVEGRRHPNQHSERAPHGWQTIEEVLGAGDVKDISLRAEEGVSVRSALRGTRGSCESRGRATTGSQGRWHATAMRDEGAAQVQEDFSCTPIQQESRYDDQKVTPEPMEPKRSRFSHSRPSDGCTGPGADAHRHRSGFDQKVHQLRGAKRRHPDGEMFGTLRRAMPARPASPVRRTSLPSRLDKVAMVPSRGGEAGRSSVHCQRGAGARQRSLNPWWNDD